MKKYNVILLTIDCLRADHVGFMGYGRPTTPFIDRLSRSSIIFKKAVVGGLPTYYSFPAIMASRYPFIFGREIIGLAPGEPCLGRAFKDAGYATAAFSASNPYLSRRFGYHQGFDCFEDFLSAQKLPEQEKSPVNDLGNANNILFHQRLNTKLEKWMHGWEPGRSIYREIDFHYCFFQKLHKRQKTMSDFRQYPSAEKVIDVVINYVNSASVLCPFFLWLHIMDAHHPYYPPEEALLWTGRVDITPKKALYINETWKRNGISARRLKWFREDIMALYDAGIRWADYQIERLVTFLKSRDLWENTVFVLTSDHGEEFLEHGGRYHYPDRMIKEVMQVPLLIHHGSGKRRQEVKGLTGMIDLAPTLLYMCGISPPTEFKGISRWENGSITPSHIPMITECVYDCRNPLPVQNRAGHRLLAAQDECFKLVANFERNTFWLFDLANDPGENHPLPLNRKTKGAASLLGAMHDHIASSKAATDTLWLKAKLAELGQRRVKS